jgi:hypothetical protein
MIGFFRTAPSLFQLPPELFDIDAMFRDFPRAQKDHGYIDVIAFAQDSIGVDVNFAQRRPSVPQQWGNLSLGFLAEVATGPGIDRNFEWLLWVQQASLRAKTARL